MADIVGSLFGFSSQELMNQQRQNDQNFATNVANIYQDPGARIGALIGANLGGGLARGVFNIQDPQIKAAQDFEAALAEAQQSSTNPAEAMSKLADKLSSDPRFARQAAMAKMKAQELSQASALNQAKIATEQQQALEAQAKAKAETDKANRLDKFYTEISTLPVTASDEDYLGVARKYGDANTIMTSIEKRQAAAEARTLRAELQDQKIEADLQKAREGFQNRLDTAKLQGANQQIVKQIEIQGKLQLQAMEDAAKAQRESIKAATTASNAGAPKDVAEATSVLAGVGVVLDNINKAETLLTSGKAKFSVKDNLVAKATLAAGNPTENALNQNEVKRVIREGVNQVLVAAKGTQTEGDARRAEELFISAEQSNSTDAWRAALGALKTAQEKIKAEKTTYIKTRGFDQLIPSSGKPPVIKLD